jgi:hypothetical protein
MSREMVNLSALYVTSTAQKVFYAILVTLSFTTLRELALTTSPTARITFNAS